MQIFGLVGAGVLSLFIAMTGLQLLSNGAIWKAVVASFMALVVAAGSYFIHRESVKGVGFFNSRPAIFVTVCGLFAGGVLLYSLRGM